MIYRYNDMAFFITGLNVYADWGISYIYGFASPIFGIVLFNNIFIILCFLLSVFFTYKLFVHFKISRELAIIFAFTYSASVYFLFRVISFTPGLYPIFIFPAYLLLLLKKRSSIFLGLMTIITLLFANYYGYFLFVITGFWYLYELLTRNWNIRKFLLETGKYTLFVILFVTILFAPLVIRNLPVFGNYKRMDNTPTGSVEYGTVYRSIEDWYNMSFRPWYFVIPPKSSVFLGNMSDDLHENIAETRYYLADDYMEEEMAGSFIGWHYTLGLLIIVGYLIYRLMHKQEGFHLSFLDRNATVIKQFLFVLVLIVMISGPPTFTISGVTFYTPSYFLYYIVPVFRTLTRWASVIFLLVLIVNAFLIQELLNRFSDTKAKSILLFTVIVLNIIFFSIKIPFIDINNPPAEVRFLRDTFPGTAKYAVYPEGDYYSIFWKLIHGDNLINARDTFGPNSYSANDFTSKLVTIGGINDLISMSPDYLIVYFNRISDQDLHTINSLNPNLNSIRDLQSFFSMRFGLPIYNFDGVLVYKVKEILE